MRSVFAACFFLFAVIAAAQAAPEKRVALVIGNNGYTALKPLKNPGIDAESLAQTLGERGFDVISCDGQRPGCFDLSRDGLTAAVAQLAAKSEGAALAFVFYAGHGMEAAEGNVLAPIDADIDCAAQQVTRGVLVDEVLEALHGAKQKIVVLDACRNDPLGQICPPATKAKLTFRQFKIPDAGNFLLVSSTKPGQVALDGLPGAHSPFARALFATLAGMPNVHFDQVFNRVSKTVIDETAKANFTQIPEMLIRGGAPEACLAGEACAADPQAAALREELETLKRTSARDQEFIEPGKAYLAQIEKNYGRPLSEDERRRALAEFAELTRSLAARNDNRAGRALDKLKAGDTAEAERLFQEDLDSGAAEEAEIAAEAQRRTAALRKKKASSARNLAALARTEDVAKALAYYNQAVDLDPDDAETWLNYADVARDAGRTDEAKAAFAQAALKAQGDYADFTRYLATLGQGDIAFAQGSLPEARRLYESASAIADRLAKADPNNAGWQRDLSVSYNKVGDVLVAQGNLPEALKSFQGSLAIRDRLAKADPNNAGWQRDLSVSYNKVGDVLVAQGNLPEALKSFQASLAIADRLAKADPNNAGWQRDLAVSNERLGDMLAKEGNAAEAIAAFERALSIYETLTTRLGDPQARVNSVVPLWRLGGLRGAAGQVELRRALGILVELRDAGRLDANRIAWIPQVEGGIAALPYKEAKAAAEAAFGAGEFAKAAAMQAKLADATEKAEREKAGKPGPDTASALLGLSWYRLFNRDFKGALLASERAAAIEPGNIALATNRAHALMFLGRAKEARWFYLRFKGQRVSKDGALWEETIRDDFKEFGKRGLTHPQIAEIEALLAAPAPRR
jgi:uncharacterized caspase-like protein